MTYPLNTLLETHLYLASSNCLINSKKLLGCFVFYSVLRSTVIFTLEGSRESDFSTTCSPGCKISGINLKNVVFIGIYVRYWNAFESYQADNSGDCHPVFICWTDTTLAVLYLHLPHMVPLPSTPGRCRTSTLKKERGSLHDFILKSSNNSAVLLNSKIHYWNDTQITMFIFI